MSLIYADFCTTCGKRRTRHPSGLCCRCRMVSSRESCVICGSKAKRGEYCYECRRRLKTCKDLDTAISDQKKRLDILLLRKGGKTFESISDTVGIPKSTVYSAYRDMMNLPSNITPASLDILLNDNIEVN